MNEFKIQHARNNCLQSPLQMTGIKVKISERFVGGVFSDCLSLGKNYNCQMLIVRLSKLIYFLFILLLRIFVEGVDNEQDSIVN